MRTIILICIALILPLFLSLLAWNTQIMWFVFGGHVLGLVVLSYNEDALRFSREFTRFAILLEVMMYCLGFATIVLALNAYFVWAAIVSLGYGAAWCVLLIFAPPFPQDDTADDSFPRHWQKEKEL